MVIVIMVIGLISGSDPMILAIVVYLMLPIGTVIFLLLLDALGQTYIIKRIQMPRSTVPLYPQLTVVESVVDETHLFEKLRKYDKRLKYHDDDPSVADNHFTGLFQSVYGPASRRSKGDIHLGDRPKRGEVTSLRRGVDLGIWMRLMMSWPRASSRRRKITVPIGSI